MRVNVRTDGSNLFPPSLVGRWFPPGTPVSSTIKLISSSSFHHLDMTLAVAVALNTNKPNLFGRGDRGKRQVMAYINNLFSGSGVIPEAVYKSKYHAISVFMRRIPFYLVFHSSQQLC